MPGTQREDSDKKSEVGSQKSEVVRQLNDSTHQQLNTKEMRTLDKNTLTEKPKNSNGFAWNSKRRYR